MESKKIVVGNMKMNLLAGDIRFNSSTTTILKLSSLTANTGSEAAIASGTKLIF